MSRTAEQLVPLTRVVRVGIIGGIIEHGVQTITHRYVVVTGRFEHAREITEALIRGNFLATIVTTPGMRYGVQVPEAQHDDAVAFVIAEGLPR